MATIYYVNNGSSYYTSSLSNGPHETGIETTITLTIKTTASYIFDSSAIPVLTLRGSSGILAKLNFTIESETVATLTTDFLVDGEEQPTTAQVTGNPRDITNAATAKFSNEIINATSSLADGSYRMGKSQTITLKSKGKYYEFRDSYFPTLTYTRYGSTVGTEQFTLIDKYTCKLETTLNPFSEIPEDGYTLNAKVKGQCHAVKCYIDSKGLVECETNYPTGYYEALNEPTVEITVSCKSGYEFEVTPYLQYGTKTLDFTQQSETLWSLTTTLKTATYYYIQGSAVKKTPIAEKYGFVMAYRLTREQVIEVSNKRWVEVTWDAEKYKGVNVLYVPNEEYIDTARYVTAFFKLFVTLETELKHKLMFGPYDMDMTVDVLADDIITLDCGTVNIVGKYQNGIDYKHTTMEIYLPFIGFTPLSVPDFMDRAVNLSYQINVMNGDALAILKADGKPMFSHSCNVAMKIPFQLGINEYVSTDLEPNNNYLLDTPPFINIQVNPATDPDVKAPYRDTKFYARFGTLTGYTEATEIDMVILDEHTFITKTEIDEIVSLLESGVFL